MLFVPWFTLSNMYNPSCKVNNYSLDDKFKIVFVTLFSIVGGIGAVVNGTVILLYFCNRRIRSKMNLFLLWLFISDFLNCTLTCSFKVAGLLLPTYGKGLKAIGTVPMNIPTVSGCILVSIIYDKYLRMSKLRNYSAFMTTRKTYVLIIANWLLPVGVFTIRFLFHEAIGHVLFLLSFLALFTTYVVFIFKLVKLIRSYMTRTANSSLSVQQRVKSLRDHKESCNMVIYILCTHLILNLPTLVSVSMKVTCVLSHSALLAVEPNDYIHIYKLICRVLLCVNSVMNPIIFTWKMPLVRKGIQQFSNRSTTK